MSNPNIQKFAEAVGRDPQLAQKLKDMESLEPAEWPPLLAALSVEAGTPASAEEFMTMWSSTELSLEELDSIAGGVADPTSPRPGWYSVQLSPYTLMKKSNPVFIDP